MDSSLYVTLIYLFVHYTSQLPSPYIFHWTTVILVKKTILYFYGQSLYRSTRTCHTEKYRKGRNCRYVSLGRWGKERSYSNDKKTVCASLLFLVLLVSFIVNFKSLFLKSNFSSANQISFLSFTRVQSVHSSRRIFNYSAKPFTLKSNFQLLIKFTHISSLFSFTFLHTHDLLSWAPRDTY